MVALGLAATALTLLYVWRIDLPHIAGRLELHRSIVEGSAGAPYQHRVLAPWITAALMQPLAPLVGEVRAHAISYAIWDLAALAATLGGTFLLVREWSSRHLALLLSLVVALVLPLGFANHYFQPWSLAEPGLFALGLVAIHRRRWWSLIGVIAVASLNRETAIILPVAYAADVLLSGHWAGERWRVVGAFAVWLTVFVGLRVLLGAPEMVQDFDTLLSRNLASAPTAAALMGAMLLPFLMVRLVRGAPAAPFVRRLWPAAAVLVGSVLVFGVWIEIRMLWPLLPLAAAAVGRSPSHDCALAEVIDRGIGPR